MNGIKFINQLSQSIIQNYNSFSSPNSQKSQQVFLLNIIKFSKCQSTLREKPYELNHSNG